MDTPNQPPRFNQRRERKKLSFSRALDSKYIPQTRPYSQDELTDMRLNLKRKLRLGDVIANHKNCGHFYYTKKGGRKETEILTNGYDNINCSVCWRLKTTHPNQQCISTGLVDDYISKFSSDISQKYLTYDNNDVENIYYSWLYESDRESHPRNQRTDQSFHKKEVALDSADGELV